MSTAKLPLTAAQLGIWLGQSLDRNSRCYHTAEYLELRGPLDRSAFAMAVTTVTSDAASLNMYYVQSDEGVFQQRAASLAELPIIDLSEESDPERRALEWMDKEREQAPVFGETLPYGSALLILGSLRHFWYLRVHHIALDGYGYWLLQRAVGERYRAFVDGKTESHESRAARDVTASVGGRNAALSHDLRTVVEADDCYRSSAAFAKDRVFFRQYLDGKGPPPVLGPEAGGWGKVVRAKGTLSGSVLQALEGHAKAAKLDWVVCFFALVARWFARETGHTEACFGVPMANRLGTAIGSVPCMAMNLVPLWWQVKSGDAWAETSRMMAKQFALLRPHQRYRYEDLKRDLGYVGGRRRLFGPVVNVMPFRERFVCPGLEVRSYGLASGPVEDLAINLVLREQGADFDIEGNFESYTMETLERYRRDLFSVFAAEIGGSSERGYSSPFRRAERGGASTRDESAPPEIAPFGLAPSETAACRASAEACDSVGTNSILSANELTEVPPDLLVSLLRRADQNPQAIALEHEGEVPLSYGELIRQVRRFARGLVDHGVRRGDGVVLHLSRHQSAILAQIAVLWVGAYYVPLDPEGPPSRLRIVLDEVQPTLIVSELAIVRHSEIEDARATRLRSDGRGVCRTCTIEELLKDVPQEEAHFPSFEVPEEPGELAYVIYTSGTTGKPCGVEIYRASLSHFVVAANVRYSIVPEDRVLQFAPLQFDASVEEIWVTLCVGGTLVLRTDGLLESIDAFLSGCERARITVLDLPTAFWHELVHACAQGLAWPSSVRLVIIGGEAALPERVTRFRRMFSGRVDLINSYGPTETTIVCATAHLAGAHVSSDDLVPIGRPLPGVGMIVLDEHHRSVPRGTRGQLGIWGATLARGYVANPALTKSRFLVLPSVAHERVYLTGDIVVLGDDDQLHFVGRIDDELKLSGHRVRLSELDNLLSGHPAVREAAVIRIGSERTTHTLVAFVAVEEQRGTNEILKDHLARHLPQVLCPSRIVILRRLPRDAHGKLDRRRLIEDAERPSLPTTVFTPAATLAPATPVRRAILQVWQDVLGISTLGVDSDFFELGGRSLQALQVASRLSRLLERTITASALFRASTVGELERYLEENAPTFARSFESTKVGDAGLATFQEEFAPLVVLNHGTTPALFCVHSADCLALSYSGLRKHLPRRAIVGFQAPGLTGASPENFEALVETYVERLLAYQPEGPVHLLGWSSGGGIAHAMAVELTRRGHPIGILAMLDSYPAEAWRDTPEPTYADALVMLLDDVDASAFDPEGRPYGEDELLARLLAPQSSLAALGRSALCRLADTTWQGMRCYRQAKHSKYPGVVHYFRAMRTPIPRTTSTPTYLPDFGAMRERWREYVGELRNIDVDASHLELCQTGPLSIVGESLAKELT